MFSHVLVIGFLSISIIFGVDFIFLFVITFIFRLILNVFGLLCEIFFKEIFFRDFGISKEMLVCILRGTFEPIERGKLFKIELLSH